MSGFIWDVGTVVGGGLGSHLPYYFRLHNSIMWLSSYEYPLDPKGPMKWFQYK